MLFLQVSSHNFEAQFATQVFEVKYLRVRIKLGLIPHSFTYLVNQVTSHHLCPTLDQGWMSLSQQRAHCYLWWISFTVFILSLNSGLRRSTFEVSVFGSKALFYTFRLPKIKITKSRNRERKWQLSSVFMGSIPERQLCRE